MESEKPAESEGPDATWESALARDVLVGTTLGEYEVVRRVGMGGMGFVYEAVQPVIGRRVALKILRPQIASDPGQVERLLAEARVVSDIHHRGIINVYGFGELPHVGHYMVMEFLNGHPLDREIATRTLLPLAEVWEILDQTLSALEAAHEARVIHRDLKPSNIFLVEETGSPRYVKLLDFGLAKRTSSMGASVAQTRQSLISGTPAYMAPEQAQGKPVTTRSDLYAVGCIAFEMLTRRLPFEGGGPIEVAYRHVHEPAPLLRDIRPSLPEAVERFVQRFLEKDPEARYASAAEARAELGKLYRELVASGVKVTDVIDPVGAGLTGEMFGGHWSDRRPAAAAAARAGLSDTIRREPVKFSPPDTLLGSSPLKRARTYVASVVIVLGAVAGGYFAARTPPVEVKNGSLTVVAPNAARPPFPVAVAAAPGVQAPNPPSPQVVPAPSVVLALARGEAVDAGGDQVVSASVRVPVERPSEEEIERARRALGEQLRGLRDAYVAANPKSPADDPVLLAIAEERKLLLQIRSPGELAASRERVKKFGTQLREIQR